MQPRRSLPEINRLSIVSAAIMMAFALTQLVSFPANSLSFSVIGIVLDFTLDFSTLISILTIILAAAGMDWLIRTHPEHQQYQHRWDYVRHWILPVLTTFVIGIALNTFAGGPYFWVIFFLGSLLLIAVFIAEYNVVTADDVRHPIATVGLTALSFALFLLLAIAVSSGNLRLYLRLPLLSIGLMMFISRALYLRTGKWHVIWAVITTLIIAEIAVGFHYVPLSPIQYGLLLVGISYSLTSIVTAVLESRKNFALWGEPAGMLAVVLILAMLWG
jgi:hypothetical protein